MLDQFKKFLIETNAIALAVAVVIGHVAFIQPGETGEGELAATHRQTRRFPPVFRGSLLLLVATITQQPKRKQSDRPDDENAGLPTEELMSLGRTQR